MVSSERKIWANLGVVLGAAGTGFSACLYLLDLATTISALVTYYSYQYTCPHAHPSSSLLRHDPICQAIRSDPVLYNLTIEFWTCLFYLLLSYPIYAFIFWIWLHPRQHPLRLAYFMPLIHLYRLLQLLCASFSLKELEELQKKQRKANSLYNALGASLESVNQFIIQFIIATRLGEYRRGSADPSAQAQRIPTNLAVSLLVSLVAACYGSSMAVALLLRPHVPWPKRACVAIVVGCQTLASILARSMCVAALYQFSKRLPIPVLIYVMSGVMIAWIYVGFLLQSDQRDYQGNNIYLRIVHSFVFALIIRPISPIYVIVKDKRSSYTLVWGAFAHILVESIGIALLLLWPDHLKKREVPCHSLHNIEGKVEYNFYLTCKKVLGTMVLSIVIFILSTTLFIWLYMKKENNPRDNQKRSTNTTISCDTTASIQIYPLSNVNVRSSHQMDFTLVLVVIIVLFVQQLQCKNVMNGKIFVY